MRLPFNYETTAKHKKFYLAAVIIFFAAFMFFSSKIKFKEDVTELLPAVLKKEMTLFQNSPLSSKVFAVVKGVDEESAQQSAQMLSEALVGDKSLCLSAPSTDADFILSYYYYAPNIWNETFAAQIAPLCESGAIKRKMEENVQLLSSPAGIFMKDFITADPIGMLPVFAQELKALNLSNNLDSKNGFISSKDGKEILLVFDDAESCLDSGKAKNIISAFEQAKKNLPQGSSAYLMGTVRYTGENNGIILKDIKRIFIVSSFFMGLLFLVFLRTAKSLLIYFVPPVVMSVAAVSVYFMFDGISGITIGFGSVLMGLAVDYSVYVYFALKASKEEDRFKTVRKMIRHILSSAVTSILTFTLLFFSSIMLFKQIALFTAAGLSAAVFLALCVAPFVFDCREKPEKHFEMKVLLKPAVAWIIVLMIFLGGVISLKFVNFNASLDSVNTVSKQFEEDKKDFENLAGNAYSDNAFFFVFGDTQEQALENNERLSSGNEGVLKLAALYPSQKKKEENMRQWKKFWNAGKIEQVKKEINFYAKKNGIKPEAFNGFYEFLETGKPPYEEEFSLYSVFNPLISHDGGWAFVNIIPANSAVKEKDGVRTMLVSNSTLREKITESAGRHMAEIMIILFACTFFVLILWLKNVQFALGAMLGPVCGICVFMIALAVTGVELNLFGLFAVPLLIGLGIDYGVFIIYQQKAEAEIHPTSAVLVAAFSTIIGFGSLMAAQHKVLFIIGFMVFTGILTAILVSIFILPALIKNSKKVFHVLLFCLLVSFAGCATSGVKYNVKEPPLPSSDNANTAMFYGSYMDDLNFRAISRTEPDGYRIVVMNDLGVKLQDMKVKKDEDTDIYFCIGYMPKEVVENFAGFFKEYYFSDEKPNIKNDMSATYYFNDKKAVIWVKKI